ncbi:MAG: outer membrane beta-barrel protein, partial [Muribaculaceae bacterium]|nr:outer membrane beta-barrel protein [Muribaculaceae bacterium]
MKRNFVLSTLMLLAAMVATATDFIGKVVDENGAAIEFATVSLLNPTDSTFITGTTTGTTGDFAITAATVSAIVKITYIGYQPLLVTSTGNMGTVRLLPETTMLGEVTVTATRPTYRLTTEGIKTDVDGTLLSKVGTANKVLENLPGVQNKGSSVEVFVKGTPLIYINGRQMRNDSELEQLSSENIQSVELITIPGAKYKADVESVILIKTKRPQGEGFSFDTQTSFWASKYPDLALGLNWNYRQKGLDVFGSVWYNDDRYKSEETVTFDVNADKQWHHEGLSSSRRHANSLYSSWGVNYIFNDRHAVGARYETKAHFLNRTTGGVVADITADGAFYDHLYNDLLIKKTSNMPHTLNVYYNGRVGKTSIDFNTDYVFFKDRTNSFNNEVSQEQQCRTVTIRSVQRNQLWASKLVLSWQLWGGNLQAGGEYDNTRRNDDYINPENIVPTTFTEQRERNYILFTEYSHPLPFGQMRLGLRNENVNSDYYYNGRRIAEQSRTYHHFFPSVGLMARAGKVQLMLNYGMKIMRPYYFMLSGNTTYVNRFTWNCGNPMLQPSVVNSLSVMAMWRWMSVMLDYKRTRDVIVNTGEAVPGSEETTIITRDNVDHADAFRAMVSLSPRFGIYQPRLTLGLLKDWVKIPSPAGFISPKHPIFLVQWNNNFQILPTLTAQANLA